MKRARAFRKQELGVDSLTRDGSGQTTRTFVPRKWMVRTHASQWRREASLISIGNGSLQSAWEGGLGGRDTY